MDTSASKYYGGEERIAHDSGNSMIIAFPGSSSFTGGSYKPEVAVLAALLGGQSSIKWSPGFSLLSKINSAHAGIQIATTHATYSDAGLLYISIDGNAMQIREAASQIVKVIKSVAAGEISKEDFTKAVASAKFNALESGQNVAAGLELTGAGLIQGGKPHQIDEVGKSIGSVTEDKVKKVSKPCPISSLMLVKSSVSRLRKRYYSRRRRCLLLEISTFFLLRKILGSAFDLFRKYSTVSYRVVVLQPQASLEGSMCTYAASPKTMSQAQQC